jgi:hypothetical protein
MERREALEAKKKKLAWWPVGWLLSKSGKKYLAEKKAQQHTTIKLPLGTYQRAIAVVFHRS